MVRLKGIEPPLCHQKRILNPSRLPVPPQPHSAKYTNRKIGDPFALGKHLNGHIDASIILLL